jgi:hypothetical protein
MTPIYLINVRRDAHTTTPVTVPEYEVALLQTLFGEENVHNADGKRIDENGLGAPAGEWAESDDEFERLANKYGAEMIESVYGKKASKGLESAIAATKKPAKKSAKPDAE